MGFPAGSLSPPPPSRSSLSSVALPLSTLSIAFRLFLLLADHCSPGCRPPPQRDMCPLSARPGNSHRSSSFIPLLFFLPPPASSLRRSLHLSPISLSHSPSEGSQRIAPRGTESGAASMGIAAGRDQGDTPLHTAGEGTTRRTLSGMAGFEEGRQRHTHTHTRTRTHTQTERERERERERKRSQIDTRRHG